MATSLASDYTGCGFASGTLLLAERGEVQVELLSPGDALVTRSGARRPVRGLASRHGASERAVRIPANGVRDGIPRRDLLVSADQAICIKVVTDALVPVESLTYKSIFERVPAPADAFWQVKLDADDVILAEGLPLQSGPAVDLRRIADRHTVEMIRAILRGRAPTLGWPLESKPLLDLHLVVDGERIEPKTRDLSFRFLVPAAAVDVWIVCEASVPKEVGFSHDRRLLGARLVEMRIDDGLSVSRTVALDDPRLGKGFHEPEDGLRWTDGCALLPRDLWSDCRDSFFVTLSVASPALPRHCAPRLVDANGDAPRDGVP